MSSVNRLPGAHEDRPWGSVHCKVADKIFVGWGSEASGELSLGFKTEKSLQSMLVTSDPRFTMAKYVGKHGWVSMRVGKKPNWDEIEQFIVASYRLIAPKKLSRALDEGKGERPRAKASPPAKKTAPATRAKRAASKRTMRAR